MKNHRSLMEILTSFLDYFIHPKILRSSSFILLRSRILIFWMLVFLAVVISNYQHIYFLVGPWHPMVLTLDYCILQAFTILIALRFFGSYRVAYYAVMLSLYLNTPVAVIYSGGLHSPILVFFLFMPLATFQLTKSLKLSLICFLTGCLEVFFVFYLQWSGWDFAGKGIIENYFPQLAGNVVITSVGIWMILSIYVNGLTQVSRQFADVERFTAIMDLSKKMVHEIEPPLSQLTELCDALVESSNSIQKTGEQLNQINDVVFQLSAQISSFRRLYE